MALAPWTAGPQLVQVNAHLVRLGVGFGAWIVGAGAVLVTLSALACADGGLAAVGIGGRRVHPAGRAVALWVGAVADRLPEAMA